MTQHAVVELKASDLGSWGGIYCPSPLAHMVVKSTHPRVMVEVASTGQGQCPYCGTIYKLKLGERAAAH